MKASKHSTFALVLASSLVLPACAGHQAGSEKPIAAQTRSVSQSAEVVGIDKPNRILTLRGQDNTVHDVEVGPDAKNFDQIKVGDIVTAQYYESAAISLRKQAPGEPAVTEGPSVVRVAPPGKKPEAVMAKTVVTSALVEDINYATREVTLKGPRGNSFKLFVDHQVPNLDEVQKGDHVVVTYSEAFALNVTPKG